MSSLMSNFDIAQNALQTSLDSSGSAMREHERWSQSLEAKLTKLKSTWQSLSQSFMKSNFLKGALDAVIALVNGLDKLIDTVGTIPTLLGLFAGGRSLFAHKGLFTFDKENKSIQALGTQLTGLKDKYSQIQNAIGRYNDISSKSASFQEKYNNAMKNSTSSMGRYLNGLNGAKASFGGYIASLVGATAKTVILEAATMALNAAITMGVSFAISAIIKLADKLIVTEEELAEKVEEVTSKFKTQHDELKKLEGDYDTSNESSMISKYEKLSKGVDNLGRNVSLTADEYLEYQNIVNKIAEQFPSLITGYDEQGNALLSVKGNVEELTEAYEKLIHAQNQDILTNTGDIEKDFANVVKDKSGQDWWSKFREDKTNSSLWKQFLLKINPITGAMTTADDVQDLFSGNKMTTDTAKVLDDLLNTDRDKIGDKIESYDKQTMSEIQTALKNAGIDVGLLGNNTAKALEKALKDEPAKIKGIVDDFYGELEETISNQKTIATAKLSEAFDVSSAISGLNYGNIGEELQAVAYQTVNSLDFDFFTKLSEQGKTVEQWTTEMLNQLNAISKEDNAEIEASFDLQTKFNGGDISYGEYVDNLRDVESTIDNLNLNSQTKKQLKISLGLDDDGVIKQYETLVNRLTDSKNYDFDISESEARKLLDGLSSEELSVAVGVITEMSDNNVKETIDQVQNAIDRELAIQGLTLDLKIETETEKIENLTSAIGEALSSTGLSNESISIVESMFGDLSGYDPSKLFERTANGIRLNTTELNKLNDEYANINLSAINKEMDSLGDIYNQTREELYNLTYGTDEYNAKAGELSTIEERIKALETLGAQYEGLASQYNQWQMAESAGSQRDMYESIISGFETVEDEISRGWYDDGTVEFLELLTGKELSTAGIDEVKKAWKSVGETIDGTKYSVKDFFTTNDDGESINTGVYNFLRAVEDVTGKANVIKRENGKIVGFDFQVYGGDEAIAEALGVSEELVQIMVRAADDAGFVVSMDGTYQQLDVLKEKAQLAAESLKKTLGKDTFDFNFNSTDVDDITKQLTEAQKILDKFRNTDGTINTKLEGADEALIVASTLQSMLDKLTRPTYMDIEVSQVEDEIQKPLQNLQELRRLLETEHQLKLTGADTSELEESKQEVYDYFEELDPEIKAEIGLVDKDGNPLTGDALKDKLNSDDLNIEATVDIQMKMDDKLGILVDKALLEAGIIDDEEFEKRVDVYLNADVDNEDAKNKTEQAVNEVASGSSGGKSSNKDKKSSSNKVEKDIDVKVKADEVDTSDVKEKTEKAVKDEKEDKLAVETTVELETTIEEASDLIQKFEDKDITIDVKVKGLDKVKELNKNIDLATEIDGSVDKLSEYVEGAKALSKLDNNITSFVTAEVKGNVLETPEYELNNLEVFAKGANELKDTGSFTTKVTADVDGNVIDTEEYKLNNLKVFTDSAKDIGKIGNIESNVKATVNTGESGDVVDTFEYKLNNLGEFATHVKALQGLNDVDISVDATVNTGSNGDVIDEFEYKLDNLGEFAKHAKALQDLEDVKVNVTATVNTGESGDVVDVFEYKLNNLSEFATHVKDLQDLNSVEIGVKATVNTGDDGDVVDTFEYKLNNLGEFAEHVRSLQGLESIDVSVNAIVNTGESGDVTDTFEYKLNNLGDFATYVKALQGLEDVDLSVNADVNTGENGDVIDTFEYKLDNLGEFAEHAKSLQGLDNVDISISAKVNTGESGDVVDTFEYKLNNLGEFAEHAKELQGLKNVDVKVSAKVNTGESGDVVDTFEHKINNLKVFAEGAKALDGVGDASSTITAKINTKLGEADATDIGMFESRLDNLKTFAEGANTLKGVGDVSSKVTAKLDTKLGEADATDSSMTNRIGNLKVFAEGANTLKGVGDVSTTVTAQAEGNVITGENATTNMSSLTEFKSLISGLSSQTVTISVKANVDAENINKAITLLKGVSNSGVFKDYSATVQVGAKIATIDDTVVKNYGAPPKEGKVSYSVDELSPVFTWTAPDKDGVVNYDAEVEALTDGQKHKSGTITYKAKIEGFGGAAGTANASGTASGRAFARGNWGIKGNGVALGGELGTELVVRDGKFFTIGDEGAQFFRYKQNDIVFNAAQTESLFKYGGIKGANPRGKMLATGTAFATGSAFPSGSTGSGGGTEVGDKYNSGSSSSSKSSSSSSKSSSSSSKDTTDDFEETFDWIQVAIDRIERAIDKLDKKANNTYASWSSRNKALASEISKVGSEISLQEQAYSRYMKEANSVGLSSSWKKKVQNGTVDISTVKNEDLAEKIGEYTEWYEKALAAKDAIQDLREEESKLYEQRFENVQTQYDGILQGYEHTETMLNEYISQAEASGHIVSKKYYQALINNEKSSIAQLKKEQAALIKARDEAVASGKITKYSESWYSMCQEIDSVTQAIEESETALISFDNAMREIDWGIFDTIQERISDVTAESDFLIELMSNKKLFEDDGKLTSQGLATMGLHGQNYNTHMYQADEYGNEVSKLDAQIAKDPYDQELINRRQELLELQRESILAAENEKDAIKDLVSEGIDMELDSLQELIDKKNEVLDSERELYEYQKQVKEQTEEIASLEKQIASYSGDDSEEAKSKVQQLKVDLENAKTDLEETEYDKWITDTGSMLDNLYLEYETILNMRIDNIDALLESVIDSINTVAGADGVIASALGSEGAISLAVGQNATDIKTTLTTEAGKVGTTLSTAMNNIWSVGDGNAKSVLTMYGEDSKAKSTTIITTLNGIKTSVNSMVASLNKEATTKTTANKTTTSSKKNPTTTTTSNKTTTTTTTKKTSSGDGKAKVGDKVKFVSGQYYYDSQGKKPLGSQNRGKSVYITSVNNQKWATHPYHISTGNKLGKGDLGWLKLNQISGYATGKKKFSDDEIAWTQEKGQEFIVRPSDGAILTPIAKSDSVLNASASNNIWDMANSPAEFIKDNLNLGTSNVPNNSNVQSSYTQHLDKVVFNFPNVKNYDEMLLAMKDDRSFEKLVTSMTIDKIAGKSSLAKGKSIR